MFFIVPAKLFGRSNLEKGAIQFFSWILLRRSGRLHGVDDNFEWQRHHGGLHGNDIMGFFYPSNTSFFLTLGLSAILRGGCGDSHKNNFLNISTNACFNEKDCLKTCGKPRGLNFKLPDASLVVQAPLENGRAYKGLFWLSRFMGFTVYVWPFPSIQVLTIPVLPDF